MNILECIYNLFYYNASVIQGNVFINIIHGEISLCKKEVKFSPVINIVLIATIPSMIKLAENDLWYNEFDYTSFKQDAISHYNSSVSFNKDSFNEDPSNEYHSSLSF